MNFSELVAFFKKLGETSSRNSMIDLLAELFNRTSINEIDKICYFLLGELDAEYKHIKLGMGDKMVIEAISYAGDLNKNFIEEKFKEMGDLGNVAEVTLEDVGQKFQDFFQTSEKLTVLDVYDGLLKIANASGSGSVEIKEKILSAMLSVASPKERKYLIRMVLGDMRLGLGTATILDGLSTAIFGSKDKRPELEHAFNVSSDIGYVAKVLLEDGLNGVKNIKISLKRPIKPMLAQRVSKMNDILEKIDSDEISVEQKYDGERIQIHKNGDDIKLFSRRLTDITKQFPDIIKNVKKFIKPEKIIIDGEAVAYDFENDEYEPFQKLMQRRRKYDVKEYADKIPVKYILFDLLYLEGKSYLKRSYPERRNELEKTIKKNEYLQVASRKVCKNLDEIDDYFQHSINLGLEGVLCKSCSDDSYYRAGAREWLWIKWKTDYAAKLSDTLDLVVIGAYAGKGKRGGTYGALLCAAYNKDKDIYQTVTKLGTGFTDEQLDNLINKLKDAKSENQPARVQVTKDMVPDFWFVPKYVLEVNGAEITESPTHTCNWNDKSEKGLALRFPRFERWRGDKKADDATSVGEILKMYNN
ncbi:MAG: ATP-dependent DNA ligase [Candidatus Lokiarchaeota archaeon]|nr:ATP-dependent DNA ligase [Candidatus Lokiarchaeota archaeon]